jgi:hypothetical protein
MEDLETFLRAEEGIEVLDVQNHAQTNLPDSTKRFDLDVDVKGGTRVTLLVGDYGGEFYVEVRRTVDTTTTCLKFREVVRAVKKHARDWA